MKTKHFPATERGLKQSDWLRSNFTFSFSSWANPERNGFGLLKVFNDDFLVPGRGFGIHPHANMEIISVLLAGRMNHIDTLGYKEIIEPGGVQIMSAGSGLRHEEYNVGDDEVNFLQIWIEPKQQNISPRYQKRAFPEANRHNRLTTIVSNDEGQAHCWINQNAHIAIGHFDTGETVTYALRPLNKAVFVFNIGGNLTVGGQPLADRDAVGVWEADTVEIQTEGEVRFLLIEMPINH
jgi:quercetin 2,3-dioxygenase